MWDQKPGMNVSALQGSERIDASGPNQHLLQNKKVFEERGEDSGFLSGPQNLYSSESIDLQSDLTSDVVLDNYRDSGAIADEDDEQQEHTNNPKGTEMLYRSGIDANMAEWLCKLNLKDSPVNNLGRKPVQTTVQEQQQSSPKQGAVKPLWETCYAQDADGDTHLHLAILGKLGHHITSMIRMAPAPAFLDIRNDDVQAPLHLAVLTSQPDIVRTLLIAGAKTTIQDREGNTPLHLACMNSDKTCIDALTLPLTHLEMQQGFYLTGHIPQLLHHELEVRNFNGMYCVHIAAQRNDTEILRHLVWLGANINAREGKSGYTPLHIACEYGYEQLAQFLLSECTQLDVETYTYGRVTAYQIAAELNNRNLMSNLERYGAEQLSPPESDDDYMDASDDDFANFGSDDYAIIA